MKIEPLTGQHGQDVLRIYQAGIDTGNATFSPQAPSWEEWDADHLHECRLVAIEGEDVLGWAALGPVSGRCVYAGVAEVSIYIDPESRGQGVGRALLGSLIEASEEAGFWTLQAGIFPKNVASLRLHEKCGFRVIGIREKLGKMMFGSFAGQWRDVVWLERRSSRQGIG